MSTELGRLLKPYASVSIIGMCKNAGKTTVLNALIRDFSGSGQALALTSIGRDGESTDLVTGTPKPGIFVPEGTLIATASQLLLRHCDVTREILDTTGISTPMGEVAIFRARSAGAVQLAGPSMTAQLARLREIFYSLGAQKVIFDGALSRKTLCSRSVSDATVLCTGASYHADPVTVAEDTAHQCRLLTLPETDNWAIRQFSRTHPDFRGFAIFSGQDIWQLPPAIALSDALRNPEAEGARSVLFGGALTDFSLKPLLMSTARLQGLRFIVRDSSKLLLSRDSVEKLQHRGAELQVLDSVNLVAVTVNPFSAYGHSCEKETLSALLRQRIDLPVINVMEEAI